MLKNSIEQLRRAMAFRYLLALSIIAVLSSASFYSLIAVLQGSDSTALVVNMSGKQRMLSQRIALNVHEIHSQKHKPYGQNPIELINRSRASLLANIKEITQTNRTLTTGKLPGNIKVSLSNVIHDMYFGEMGIAQRVNSYVQVAQQVLQTEDSIASLRVVEQLDSLSQSLVDDLDLVVSQYQREGEQKLLDIKPMQFWLWIFTLLIVLLQFIFIFRPMQRKIIAVKEVERKAYEHLNDLVDLRTQKLKEANQKLRVLAQHDPLTGLKNRLTLESEIEQLIAGYQSHGVPFAVVVMDIDWFKKVNDQYGHAAGDLVLTELANVLKKNVREYDEIYRAGGEEFVLVFNRISLVDALQLLESLRQSVGSRSFSYQGTSIMVTVSCGVYHTDHVKVNSVSECLLLADNAMYESKKNGRNRITESNYNVGS